MTTYGIQWADGTGLHTASTDNVCTLADLVSMVRANGGTVSALSSISGYGRVTQHTADGVLSTAATIRARTQATA